VVDGRFWRSRVGIKKLGGGKCFDSKTPHLLHFLYPGQARRSAFALLSICFENWGLKAGCFGFGGLGFVDAFLFWIPKGVFMLMKTAARHHIPYTL
jgi:hypothetical protein